MFAFITKRRISKPETTKMNILELIRAWLEENYDPTAANITYYNNGGLYPNVVIEVNKHKYPRQGGSHIGGEHRVAIYANPLMGEHNSFGNGGNGDVEAFGLGSNASFSIEDPEFFVKLKDFIDAQVGQPA